MYDNLGYGLLAVVLQRLTGQDYHQAVKELVFQPLGIDATLGEEPPRPPIFWMTPVILTPARRWSYGTRSSGAAWGNHGEGWWRPRLRRSRCYALTRGSRKVSSNRRQLRSALRDQAGGLGGGFPWQQWPHCPWGLGPEIILDGMQHWMDPSMRGGMIGHGGYSGCCVMSDPATQVTWSIHGTNSAAKPWCSEAFGTIRAAIRAAVG